MANFGLKRAQSASPGAAAAAAAGEAAASPPAETKRAAPSVHPPSGFRECSSTGATVFVISDLCLVTERPGWCAEAPGRRLLELVVSGQ